MAANAQRGFQALDEVVAPPARFDSCAGAPSEQRALNQRQKGALDVGLAEIGADDDRRPGE
jgi:hypothetical protein